MRHEETVLVRVTKDSSCRGQAGSHLIQWLMMSWDLASLHLASSLFVVLMSSPDCSERPLSSCSFSSGGDRITVAGQAPQPRASPQGAERASSRSPQKSWESPSFLPGAGEMGYTPWPKQAKGPNLELGVWSLPPTWNENGRERKRSQFLRGKSRGIGGCGCEQQTLTRATLQHFKNHAFYYTSWFYFLLLQSHLSSGSGCRLD